MSSHKSDDVADNREARLRAREAIEYTEGLLQDDLILQQEPWVQVGNPARQQNGLQLLCSADEACAGLAMVQSCLGRPVLHQEDFAIGVGTGITTLINKCPTFADLAGR